MTPARQPSVTATLLRYLATASKHRTMYPLDHPIVKRAMEDLVQVIDLLLRDHDEVRFQIYEDTFFLDNLMLPEESLRNAGLLQTCLEREVGKFTLQRGITAAEVNAFVGLLTTPLGAVRTAGGAEGYLKAQGVQHIATAPPSTAPPTERAIEVDPVNAYEAGHTVAQDLRAQAARRQPLDMNKARVFLSAAIEVVLENRTALLALTAGKAYDEASSYHAVNVSILSLLLGTRLGFDHDDLMALGMCALLHDIGKVRVPQELLNRATELTPDELTQLNRHPIHGGNILRELEGLGRVAATCALEHHAHVDGSGYPPLTLKPQPHVFSRIVAVADAYDTVTAARRGTALALRPEIALKWIAVGLGSVYDPVVGKVFLRMMGAYPVGSVVQLDNGDLAVVLRPPETKVDRPVVQVVRNGQPADVIDLAANTSRSITVGMDAADAGIDVDAILSHTAA